MLRFLIVLSEEEFSPRLTLLNADFVKVPAFLLVHLKDLQGCKKGSKFKKAKMRKNIVTLTTEGVLNKIKT